MLPKDWFLSHVPAKGSQRAYVPPRSFADAERALERRAARRSYQDSREALRGAEVEQLGLERAFA